MSAWDETIVPALRKRLESESRILAKRISIASVASIDAPQPEPSATPRPSLQATHPRTDTPRVNGTSSFSPKRARTYSQPPSPNAFSNNPLPTPDSSRPTSPRTSDVKPTRIPVAARTRTASASSHPLQRADSHNGTHHRPYQPPTPDTSQDHRVVKPSEPIQPSTPPMASIRHQASNILNEPPPFATSSITSSLRSRIHDPGYSDPRPSNDSEERPFEHWYRGDVHRNGGVGELRVAKHVEMLQIANYGHNLRMAVRRQSRDYSGHMDTTRWRRRADSVDAGTHESLYLDDAPPNGVGMVFDESPLTDIEAETDPETFYDAYAGIDTEVDADDTIHAGINPSSPDPLPAPATSDRSHTPTNPRPVQDVSATPKHATYTRIPSNPLRSSTSSTPRKVSVECTRPTPGPRAHTVPRATSPISQSSDQSHTKRRAKSPAASSPTSTPKKVRTKVRTPPSNSRRDDPRSSIATYPTPEGDVVDAIPTWTQPVQKTGNWDEVVLPVVARKRGLDSQYEHADGSPKPRLPEHPLVKPAPGTFGYDYTKYRPSRRSEEIQMHEFGRLPEHVPLPEEVLAPPPVETFSEPKPPPAIPEEPIREDPRQTVSKPPDSPAPFSRYHIEQVPTINVTRPSTEMAVRRQEQEYEDVAGGCCKCVIM